MKEGERNSGMAIKSYPSTVFLRHESDGCRARGQGGLGSGVGGEDWGTGGQRLKFEKEFFCKRYTRNLKFAAPQGRVTKYGVHALPS